jgi:hypothetical protein
LVAPASEMTIEPPLNRVAVTYNQTNIDLDNSNLITNGCFDEWEVPFPTDPSSTYPSHWALVGEDFTAYDSKIGNQRGFTFEPTAQATATTFDSTIYLEQYKYAVNTATTDSLQLSFDFHMTWSCSKKTSGTPNNAIPQFFYNDLTVTFEMEIKIGTYYLSGDVSAGYSWTTTASRATFEQVGFDGAFGSYVANYNATNTISTTLPTLPENGSYDFSIKVYRPYSDFDAFKQTITTDFDVSLDELSHKCLKMIYLPVEVAPVETLVLKTKIIEDENVEEIEVMHGDGTNTVTMNSFRLSNGVITDSWDRRGVSESAEILTILLKQLRDLRGEFKKNLSANLIGEFEVYNTIEHTTDVTTEYYIADYTWKVEVNEWDCTLKELITSVVLNNANTVKETAAVSETTNNSGAAVAPPVGPESKVVEDGPIINPNQVNLNGYI